MLMTMEHLDVVQKVVMAEGYILDLLLSHQQHLLVQDSPK